VKRSGGGAAFAYADTRDGRRVLVLRPAPRLEARPFDVALLLPTQLPRRAPTPRTCGPHALLVRLLLDALADAGCLGRSPRWRRRAGTAVRMNARAWLAGELEDQVALPVATVCDALGLDAAALAAAVRARVWPESATLSAGPFEWPLASTLDP
jgi:hypothetical protein